MKDVSKLSDLCRCVKNVLSSQEQDTNTPSECAEMDSDDEEDEENDKDFLMKSKYKKKEKTVLLELPRDIMNSPDVVSMLDRTGTTRRKAVGVVSSILKSGKIDGKEVELS